MPSHRKDIWALLYDYRHSKMCTIRPRLLTHNRDGSGSPVRPVWDSGLATGLLFGEIRETPSPK